jgi:hypothetical protein
MKKDHRLWTNQRGTQQPPPNLHGTAFPALFSSKFSPNLLDTKSDRNPSQLIENKQRFSPHATLQRASRRRHFARKSHPNFDRKESFQDMPGK